MYPPPRGRQPEERARYEFLLHLYLRAREDPHQVIHAGEIGSALRLSPVQTFSVVEFLADQGYLEYLSAGPRVRISARGIRYIEWEGEDRRTVR